MLHKILKLFLAVLLVGMIPLAYVTLETKAAEQVVRVGYVENNGMINTPSVTGSEGYGYEYFEHIIDYTQGEYSLEFVACTWGNYQEKLDSGEIDLFGPVCASSALSQKYDYAEQDIGENALFLATVGNADMEIETYDALNGCRIGVSTESAAIDDFLAAHNIDAQTVSLYDGYSESVFTTYDLDYCVISALQLANVSNLKVIAQIDVIPMYCIALPQNQALLDDIDQAVAQIAMQEYKFEEKLYLEYYNYDLSVERYISPAEFKEIQSKKVYRVGLQNLHSPFSNINESGEFTGVAVDFLEQFSAYAGIDFEIVTVNANTKQSVLSTIDFYLFPTDETLGVANSISYLEIPLILVDHSATLDTVDTIGILNYYGINSLKEEGKILGRNAIEYSNLETLCKAFNTGVVDSMIVTTASLNYIRADIEDSNFLSTSLSTQMQLNISYAEGFPKEYIEVFDKVIVNLDTPALEYALLKNSSNNNISLIDVVKRNPIIVVVFGAFVMLIIGLVDERRRHALFKRINYDALTGLYSRHRFGLEVEKRRNMYRRRQYQLVSIDIDNFKYINEIYGYSMGTKILKKIGEAIKQTVDRDAVVARSYADNFLVFGKKQEKGFDFNQYLLKSDQFNQELNAILGTEYRFSFSIGIYDVPATQVALDYMIDCANMARELGKDTTGTTFHKFSEEINLERAKNNEIAASMDAALEAGEFELYYQPKVDLVTEKLVGAEALVRWNRNGKMVSPYHFIPLFEKNGFIQKLDLNVLAQACQFVKENANRGLPKISVNLSGVTIAKTDVVANVTQILAQYGVEPSQIDIEITESAFVGNDVAQDTVTALENMGLSISMDDFGAGISSLNRLKNLEIDTLKIDREFIVDYMGNKKGTVILKSMISMAKALNIETVAEGIETKEQMESLLRYGCDVGQGYYFSRPLSGAAFLEKYMSENIR